jgi:hypothetical protein
MGQIISKRGFLALASFVALGGMLPTVTLAEEKKEGAMSNPLTVEIPGVVVPVANGRRLANYVFMTIVVTAADDRSANIIRANMMLVKDAIVRDASKNPIPLRQPANYFDKADFCRKILPVVGGALIGVKVTRIDVLDAQFMRR